MKGYTKTNENFSSCIRNCSCDMLWFKKWKFAEYENELNAVIEIHSTFKILFLDEMNWGEY